MKTVILTIILLATGLAQAKVKTEVLTAEQFIQVIGEYLKKSSSDIPNAFSGDLAEIGGGCIVSIQPIQPGKVGIARLVMNSDKGFKIDAAVFKNDIIKLQKNEAEDGSYQHSYSFGSGGLNKIVISHVDDASDSITLQTGTTRLLCGVDY